MGEEPAQDEWIEVRGKPAVVRRARGAGPPLVFLPGCGGDHHAFDALLDQLAGRERVVVCLPGRAGMAGPAPASVAEAAGFVAAVVAALGLVRPVLAGHSYGGGIAIECALGGAFELGGLVLMNTGARLRAHPAILAAAYAAAEAEPTAAANLADWVSCNAFNRLDDVGRVAVPTRVLVGADDAFTPVKYATFLAEHIPGAQLTVIEGAGHDAPVTHAGEVAAVLRGIGSSGALGPPR